MKGFTKDPIRRQDFVDNQIYDLVRKLIPSEKKIEWDIEMVGDIRDTIQHWLGDRYKIIEELEFYKRGRKEKEVTPKINKIS